MSKWKNHRQARTHEDGLRPVTCHSPALVMWVSCGRSYLLARCWTPLAQESEKLKDTPRKSGTVNSPGCCLPPVDPGDKFQHVSTMKGPGKKIPNACCSTSALQISHWNVSWGPTYFLAYSGENSGKHNSACPSWHRNKLLVYAVTQMNLRSTMASEEAYHKRL